MRGLGWWSRRDLATGPSERDEQICMDTDRVPEFEIRILGVLGSLGSNAAKLLANAFLNLLQGQWLAGLSLDQFQEEESFGRTDHRAYLPALLQGEQGFHDFLRPNPGRRVAGHPSQVAASPF